MLLNRSFNGGGYSKTVLVPRSKFPARHDPKVEIKIQEDTKFSGAYLEQDLARKPYVIHDGPPFANGAIHLGHAINKILKDIAARYAMITGHRVEFITGWDCHGLPIELRVLKSLEQQQSQASYGGSLVHNSTASPDQFRARARAFAKSQIDLQMSQFKRMGLLTDWNKRYTTDDPSYVANQLRAFSQLFEQKLVFKDLMPVNWSLVNRTAISDADVDFKDNHISKSAYVICEIISPPFYSDLLNRPLYALVWTTTPWTLAENRAIGFNKQETYCIIRAQKTADQDTLSILSSIDTAHKTHQLLQRLGYQSETLTYVPGDSLRGLTYKPLLSSIVNRSEGDNEPRPFLHGEFVDGAKGTGLVHLAPNYGEEDFALVKSKGLPVHDALVGPNGRFEKAAGEILKDKYIFTDGTQEILSALDSERALLFTELTQHSYAYETRTDQPIITRTSQQIFLDTSRLIPRCLKAFEDSSFYPEHRKLQIINSLATSPNWCISRQRIWGTPIPVLYHKDDTGGKKMISHPDLIEHLCKLLYKKRSMDFWWTADNKDIVPQELLQQCKLPYKSDELVRGMDIFDVWSDSGLSWHTLASGLNDNKTQADLYLEGSDQIRGWFSASTLLSMALRSCLPSKRFFVHGFALDGKGRKMSKSQGNVVDPLSLYETYGVDPIRYWAARTAGGNRDIHVKHPEIKSSGDLINKIRITLKYLIGALEDHDAVDGKLDPSTLTLFDQYYLDKLYRFGSTIDAHYKKYEYDKVVRTINEFILNDFSPIYIDSIKDLLYCDEPDSERRKSCMTILNISYNVLTRCLYPLIPHVVYEAGQYMRSSQPLNEWQDLGYSASWKNNVLHNQVENLVEIRRQTARILAQKFNSKNRDAVLYLTDKKLCKSLTKVIQSAPDLFAELFKTSNFLISYKEQLTKPENVLEHPIIEARPDISTIDSETTGLSTKFSEESLTFTSYWTSETEDRIGGTLKVDGGSPTRFELTYQKTGNKKCPRCRRYATVASDTDSEDACLCGRCKGALRRLEMLD